MFGLASAAFFGAIFHGFFPGDTATTAGFIAWVPVSLSIVGAAAAMLELGLTLLLPSLAPGTRRTLVTLYALGFAGVVLLVDESFASIVRFYVPALLLFLIGAARQVVRGRIGWSAILGGLVISVLAALLQQAKVAIDPDRFDHNAVYHVVQSVALLFLYVGFRNPATSPG
jgi:O-antigen ligase